MYDPSVSSVPLLANSIFDVKASLVGVSFVHARPIATLNMIIWGEIGYIDIYMSPKEFSFIPKKLKICLLQMRPTRPQKQVPVLVVFQSKWRIVCQGQ